MSSLVSIPLASANANNSSSSLILPPICYNSSVACQSSCISRQAIRLTAWIHSARPIAGGLIRSSSPGRRPSYFRHLRAILAYHRHPGHDVVILRVQAKEPRVSLTNAKHAINGKQKALVLLIHCGLHAAVIQRLNDHCLFPSHLFHIAGDGALEFASDGMVCSTFGAIACPLSNFIPGKAL